MRYRVNVWYQVDGDGARPEKYGATYAKEDRHGNVEVRKIQPTREYVGDEAREVAYPFWSREGIYDREALQACLTSYSQDEESAHGWHPIGYIGAQPADFDLTERADRFRLACAMLDYGQGAEEGPSGWSKDVLAGIGRAASRRDYQAEDRDFRAWLKEGDS